MINRTGFVPQQYVVDAIFESQLKRHNHQQRTYKRLAYESVEHNTEFEVMLDDEIRKISGFNPFTCRDYRE